MPNRPALRTLCSSGRWFGLWTGIAALIVAGLLVAIALQVGIRAWPAIQQLGLGFLVQSGWSVGHHRYGIWPQLYGTVVTAGLALALALPIGLGIAIALSESWLPLSLRSGLVFLVELLAAIPSVVYGLWGIYGLTPTLRPLGAWLHHSLGWIPLFGTAPLGPGIYVAATLLAIMILPILTAIARDALATVPSEWREAAASVGATRWEIILGVALPAARSGILGGVVLALGRALGETMAVAMVIGNVNRVSVSLFAPGSTIAALLANQFAEARDEQIATLMYAALVLFAITLVVNGIAVGIGQGKPR